MPQLREFNAFASIGHLLADLNSVGAHVAAKLGCFGSDERTLTDDLCDMFIIWATHRPDANIIEGTEQAVFAALPQQQIWLRFRKTTVFDERRIGADLEFRVVTPLGAKRALIQAKARDSQDGLRCGNKREWERLRHQLRDMRTESRLAFLGIYVPSTLLNHALQGFLSWEQDRGSGSHNYPSSKLGVTLIPVDDLLDSDAHWLRSPPVQDNDNGTFEPQGMSLGRLLLDMLSCNIGAWDTIHHPQEDIVVDSHFPQPRVSLECDFTKLNKQDFQRLANTIRTTIQRFKLR